MERMTRNRRTLAVALGISLLLAILLLSRGGEGAPEEIPLSSAIAKIESGQVEKVILDDNTRTAELTLEDGEKFRTGYTQLYGTELTERLVEKDVTVEAKPLGGNTLGNLLFSLLPVVLIIGFLFFLLNRKGGMTGGIGRLGKGKEAPVEIPATRFVDVAGVDEAVDELKEVVDFLHNPDRFKAAGAKVPHGFLLEGPPGTGKTLLARAVAGEAGVPFFALSGSDFVEMFVGVGARRVRDLFDKARASERAIIFIDEIDAVGKARTGGQSQGATEEREGTLNALLVEMDGFTSTGIIVLAATNRSDVLDPALLRPGRFDRKITVPAPDVAGRRRLFELYAKSRSFEGEIDWASYARRTPGLTGADIAFLLNEAALEAARQSRGKIASKDLDSALATSVLGRERRSAVITERDRRITAWHEAGHAIAALLQPHADDPISLTIVPRGPAGGVTWMGGNDDSYLTKSSAKAQLVVSLAGRAAEERLLGGDYTQGATGDLQAATNLATQMVATYGMSETGRLVFLSNERLSVGGSLDQVNTEVDHLLQDALVSARELLETHQAFLEEVVRELLEVETLSLEDLMRIQLDVEGKLPTEVTA